MRTFLGVTFGDKHSYRDWNLRWVDVDIGYPNPKTKIIDIPGCSAVIDLTEALTGEVEYEQRDLTFKFETQERNFYDWETLRLSIANALHGKKMQIVLDTDPNYYYTGRAEVDFEKSDKEKGELTIKATCEPYKHSSGGEKKL